MSPEEINLLPLFLEVDGFTVEILEVLEHRIFDTIHGYSFSLRINYKGIKSKIVSIDAKDLKDLINKLKIEITKIKFFEIVYGLPEVRRLIT